MSKNEHAGLEAAVSTYKTDTILKLSCMLYLPSTAVAKALHDWIDLLLENLSQLGAVLVDP